MHSTQRLDPNGKELQDSAKAQKRKHRKLGVMGYEDFRGLRHYRVLHLMQAGRAHASPDPTSSGSSTLVKALHCIVQYLQSFCRETAQ